MSFLKIAIPKKGRIQEPTTELLHKAGYRFSYNKNILYSVCKDSNIEFIFLRADDIPLALEKGVVDLGITGSDIVFESNPKNITSIKNLNYGKCELVLAIAEEMSEDLELLKNKRIATSFPNITQAFFEKKNIPIQCLEMNGSIEITIKLGIADAIVDITETGNSLIANNLKTLEKIGTYETKLYANNTILKEKEKEINNFCLKVGSVLLAREYSVLEYNILKDNILKIKEITPGYRSPTITPLEDSWLAVKVMVKKEKVIDTMLQLKETGATAIFETKIRNCMF